MTIILAPPSTSVTLADLDFKGMQDEAILMRFDESKRGSVANWVRMGYERVWSARGWIFKEATTNLAVVANNASPVLPVDFGDVLEIYNDQGVPLEGLEQSTFDDYYLSVATAGQSGPPEAYKFVAGVLTLGPKPNQTVTFKFDYTRQLCCADSTGTLKVGNMSLDGDLPLWNPTPDGAHHMILVTAACIIGEAFNSDMSSIMLADQYTMQLDAMSQEFVSAEVGRDTKQYGRDMLGLAARY